GNGFVQQKRERPFFLQRRLSLSDDCELNILSEPQHSRDQTSSRKNFQMMGTRPRQKYLRDVLTAGEFNECSGGIPAVQHARFDVEIASEIEMLLYDVALRGR